MSTAPIIEIVSGAVFDSKAAAIDAVRSWSKQQFNATYTIFVTRASSFTMACPRASKPRNKLSSPSKQRSRSTLKCQCPAKVNFYSAGGGRYKVTSMTSEHNHEKAPEVVELTGKATKALTVSEKKLIWKNISDKITSVKQLKTLSETKSRTCPNCSGTT